MSSSSTSLTQDATNKAFIRKFKTDHAIKAESKLITPTDRQNTWAVAQGVTLTDAGWWRKFCDEFKFATDEKQFTAMNTLLDMATKCECHPIHLVFLARTTYGAKKFDAETVQELHDNLLAYDDEHNENPTSAEAYDIDDDAVALESGKEVVSQSKKRSRLMTAGEALTQDCYLTDCEGDHTDF